MPTLDVSQLNIVLAVLGSFIVVFGLFADRIKSIWYLGEALPAVITGVVLGPAAAGFLDPGKWGSAEAGPGDGITLGVMRVVIGIQLVIAGYQLPAKYVRWHYKEIIVCLLPIMTLMWLSTSMCILAVMPNLSLQSTLVIGACVTSTDPILSQAVAKGPFTDKYVARPLREIISAEAGANDGFGSPFVMLSVNLMRLSIGRPETILERDRGVGEHPSDLGIAIGNWAVETLVYIVLLAAVYGAVTGFCARVAVHFSLSRKWIDTESYLLFPTALGLFIVGTTSAIGTSDPIACFVAGCALNWDGQFLAETERRHDEVNSCIDILLNFGGFMYIGTALPWEDFHQPDTTGVTLPRLFGLAALVLLLRRIPALLITYRAMPSVVKNWKEAIFMGYFGPIGAGSVVYLEHTRLLFNMDNPPEKALVDVLCPVVYFLVLTSIIVHGVSIPILNIIYRYCGVKPITDDAVELKRRSMYVPTPANAFKADQENFIAYNRFFRPLSNLGTIPLARVHSGEDDWSYSRDETEKKRQNSTDCAGHNMLVKRLFLFSRAVSSNSSLQHRLKYLASAGLVAVVLYLFFLNRPWWHLDGAFHIDASKDTPYKSTNNHPIHNLAQGAQLRFKQLLEKRATSLDQAASRYRERRHRHPPPGFDAWYAAAQKSNAIVVEEFFDRIYHDINPFWAIEPAILRRMIKDEQHFIRVRDGKAWFVSDHLELRQPWVQRWTELVQEIMPNLPDLDMVLNVMDETRILVPWEQIAEYVAKEQSGRDIFHPSEAIDDYTKYTDDGAPDAEPAINVEWISGEQNIYWDHYRVTCPPDAPGRNVTSLDSINRPPIYPTEPMPFTTDGFIRNFTESSDPCLQPHIRGMQGTFIESVSMATTHSLFPMFGGCKLPGNNEILIPGGMILDDDDLFSGGRSHGGDWGSKKNALIWRGAASGGRHKEDTWWGFQRHRFVQMMNGTTVSRSEAGVDVAPSFNLSSFGKYNVQAHQDGVLGEWISSFSDVGFVEFECFPRQSDKNCWYLDPYMKLQESIHMKKQYDYKFLPDIDGNSYSGRFRAFMRSTSLVLKSTIYAEWHDDRLVPWVHFVPFDNTFLDIYAILEYYLDDHDAEAQKIAEDGRQWAEKVMRREDMMLYVWRLLLEYARVMDPSRDRLAFVRDLLD
ncbi:Sodium/hydrogen exchanger family-domain-containing protein [Xylaria nigripes]|nr:Sodium/hydrogen exchanger family-domain-containing protein [Xylaria nigripes]